MMNVNLSVEIGSTVSQKCLKLFAPDTVKIKCGHSRYSHHYRLLAEGPSKDLRKFLKNYISFGVIFMERGSADFNTI